MRPVGILRVQLALGWLAVTSCTPAINYLDPTGPKFSNNYRQGVPARQDTIKVVTFNIKFSEKIQRAIAELSTFASLQHADIVLLQEVDESGADEIARALRCEYVYYPATLHPRHGKNFGNAVLSRWPILESCKVPLPYRDYKIGQLRIAVIATVALAETELVAVSVHTENLWLGEEKRFRQIETLVQTMSPETAPLVVAGDFNTVLEEGVRITDRTFQRAGFEFASKRVGGTAKVGPFAVVSDHIFVRGLRVLASGKVRESQASDHLPVWALLRLQHTPNNKSKSEE